MKVLVSGLSSWIGHYAANQLATNENVSELYGSYRRSDFIDKTEKFQTFQLESNLECCEILEKIRPDVFIHLARGENEEDFRAHKKFIEIMQQNRGHYAFASSFNACDAQLAEPHFEEEAPNAQSEYGQFKARCERELEENCKSYSAMRFAATHGSSPNRKARTEEFLERLQNGDSIEVSQGVLQNRTFVGDLAGMIVDCALQRIQGVVNLGPHDASEEIDFLRSLAEAFGYKKESVRAKGATTVNAFMVPHKISKVSKGRWRLSESKTLEALFDDPGLQKYKRP